MCKIQQYQAITFIVYMYTNPRSTQSRKLFFSHRSHGYISSRFQTEREHWEIQLRKLVAAEATLAWDQAMQQGKQGKSEERREEAGRFLALDTS